jgi:putative DNA primase/helicase
VLLQIGVIDAKLLDGKHHPCPWCGGKDRWRWTNHKDGGGFFCSQCGHGDGVELTMRSLGLDFKAAARRIEGVLGDAKIEAKAVHSDDADRAAMNRLWRQSRPCAPGDPADTYLLSRLGKRTSGDGWSAALRSIDRCDYWSDGAVRFFPAMLAKVCAPDGKPSQIHRTYLTPDGVKAPVPKPRKLMHGALPKGSAIRLAEIGDGGVIGVAEGVETAMAVSLLHSIPVWACICAGHLADFEPPEAVRKVIIFGDNDASFTGQEAAYRLAKRLTLKDIGVDVQIPSKVGDWNDALRADWHGEAHAFS